VANESTPQAQAYRWLFDPETPVRGNEGDTNDGSSNDDDAVALQRLVQTHVLVTVYYSTGGEEAWTDATGWLDRSAHECAWRGVVCSTSGSTSNAAAAEAAAHTMTLLEMADMGLVGTLPPELHLLSNLSELGRCTALRQLFLHQTRLTGPIPSELGLLTNLQALAVAAADVAGTIPPELDMCAALKELWLFALPLTGTILSELGLLTALQMLTLSEANVSGPIPTELGMCTALNQLLLYETPLTGALPSELGLLTELQRMWIHMANVSGSIPTELGWCTELEELELYEFPLSGTIPTELGALSRLEALGIFSSSVDGTIPTEIGRLEYLTQLRLHETSLSGRIPIELARGLEKLWLYSTSVNGTIPSGLGNRAALTNLALDSNPLTGGIPAELGSLTNLVELYLNTMDVTGTIPTETWRPHALALAREPLRWNHPHRAGDADSVERAQAVQHERVRVDPLRAGTSVPPLNVGFTFVPAERDDPCGDRHHAKPLGAAPGRQSAERVLASGNLPAARVGSAPDANH
jgi:hypothetical protein